LPADIKYTWEAKESCTAYQALKPFVKKMILMMRKFRSKSRLPFLVLLISVPLLAFVVHPDSNFRAEQKRYSRVRQAYDLKLETVRKLVQKQGLELNDIRIFIRVLKAEQELQVFGRRAEQSEYVLIQSYPFCTSSGTLGPKEKQGDYQIPEGCYYIDRFNPQSSFHLSLGVNYPNNRDRKHSPYSNLGGDIFLHGDCVTIGCVPITDDKIRELYLLCVEARTSGQTRIPVHFFPAALHQNHFDILQENWKIKPRNVTLWQELKPIYDAFEETKVVPKVRINSKGSYYIVE